MPTLFFRESVVEEIPPYQMNPAQMNRIAFFISPHGFGHAARAASVMEALAEMDSSIRFDIFTTVPAWFFDDNLCGLFTYHNLETDIGLVQRTPFEVDIQQTLRTLNQLYPYDASRVAEISQHLHHLKSKLVICDIAPLGILCARETGIRSVLVENFTWDWIYQTYADGNAQLMAHIDYLTRLYNMADVHIQTEPVCNSKPGDLLAGPASRKIKLSKTSVRKKLCLPSNHRLILITTGGIPQKHNFIDELYDRQDIHFVIPCGCPAAKINRNLILLPHHSDFFHPDLVNASDAVIGKAGYSTIAEIYHSGVPFGYIPATDNPESEKLVDFIQSEMSGSEISVSEFQAGNWINGLNDLVNMPRIDRNDPNGAYQIAEYVLTLLT